MCGIAGFYAKQFDPELGKHLRQAGTALNHRGPDDHGCFLDRENRIGLVHTRLAIQDPSSLGHQPMFNDDRSIALTFNGEIYNFRELRYELEDKGLCFRGGSDTEVLLNLYIDEGVAMLSRLNGIFAFALWDLSKRSLLIARDALGVKPLYYSASPKIFTFASEIKGLLNLLPDDLELDHIAIQRYLTFLWCPDRETPVKTVHKLLPGEALLVTEGQIAKKWQWYRLPVFRGPNQNLDDRSAIQKTEQKVRTAVHRQMISDVPVGAFLSGGLDSSAVVAFAREQNPNICCFTIESTNCKEDGFIDDLPYARSVANYLNVPLEVVHVDAKRMADDLQAMVAHLDEPLADPAPLNVLYISRLAREHGIKVLLSGAGGDDLFTGYRRHYALMLERFWSWLPSSMLSKLEILSSSLNQKNYLFRRLKKFFNGAALEGDARLVNYFRWINRIDLESLYSPEFRKEIQQVQPEDPMLTFLNELPSKTSRLERMLALEQRFFLSDHNLNYTDKMSMATGVEVRVPFLDLDLVDFAACIPNSFKQRGSEGKWVLKKAMESYLPHKVIYRPKTGFGAPLRHWMRNELRELLGDLLSEESLNKRGLFDPIGVQRLITSNDAGRLDASYTLLSLLCIEIWCRHFIDSPNLARKQYSH